MEKPIVAYKVSGLTEAVQDGKTGLLVKWSDKEKTRVERLSKAIDTLINDSSKRIEMGKDGREFVLNTFDPNDLIERHEKAYVNAMGNSFSVSVNDKEHETSSPVVSNIGGIDLNPANLNLQTKGQGIDFNIPFNGLPCIDSDGDGVCEAVDMEEFENMNINGFTPVIFQIVPVNNIRLLLGINEDDGEEPPVSGQSQELQGLGFLNDYRNKYFRKQRKDSEAVFEVSLL